MPVITHSPSPDDGYCTLSPHSMRLALCAPHSSARWRKQGVSAAERVRLRPCKRNPRGNARRETARSDASRDETVDAGKSELTLRVPGISPGISRRGASEGCLTAAGRHVPRVLCAWLLLFSRPCGRPRAPASALPDWPVSRTTTTPSCAGTFDRVFVVECGERGDQALPRLAAVPVALPAQDSGETPGLTVWPKSKPRRGSLSKTTLATDIRRMLQPSVPVTKMMSSWLTS